MHGSASASVCLFVPWAPWHCLAVRSNTTSRKTRVCGPPSFSLSILRPGASCREHITGLQLTGRPLLLHNRYTVGAITGTPACSGTLAILPASDKGTLEGLPLPPTQQQCTLNSKRPAYLPEVRGPFLASPNISSIGGPAPTVVESVSNSCASNQQSCRPESSTEMPWNPKPRPSSPACKPRTRFTEPFTPRCRSGGLLCGREVLQRPPACTYCFCGCSCQGSRLKRHWICQWVP